MVQEEHTDQTNGTGTIKSIVFQQIWGERYIDDAIMRIRCENSGAGQPGYAAYDQLSDAQFSTVAVLDEAMSLVERVRCFAYGAAQRTPRGDMNGDGLCDFNDEDEYFANGGAQIDTPNYKAEMDFDRNGIIDDDDAIVLDEAILNPQFVSAVQISNVGVNAPGPRNPVGYCGYLFNRETRLYTVRFRNYTPGLGRWLERDPAGYVDGMGLYEYVRGSPLTGTDPMGLDRWEIEQRRRNRQTLNNPCCAPASEPFISNMHIDYMFCSDSQRAILRAALVRLYNHLQKVVNEAKSAAASMDSTASALTKQCKLECVNPRDAHMAKLELEYAIRSTKRLAEDMLTRMLSQRISINCGGAGSGADATVDVIPIIDTSIGRIHFYDGFFDRDMRKQQEIWFNELAHWFYGTTVDEGGIDGMGKNPLDTTPQGFWNDSDQLAHIGRKSFKEWMTSTVCPRLKLWLGKREGLRRRGQIK